MSIMFLWAAHNIGQILWGSFVETDIIFCYELRIKYWNNIICTRFLIAAVNDSK